MANGRDHGLFKHWATATPKRRPDPLHAHRRAAERYPGLKTSRIMRTIREDVGVETIRRHGQREVRVVKVDGHDVYYIWSMTYKKVLTILPPDCDLTGETF